MTSTQINIPSFHGPYSTGLVFALIEGLKPGESLNLVCDSPTDELEDLLNDADLQDVSWSTKKSDPPQWILHVEKNSDQLDISVGCCGLCGQNKIPPAES